MARYPAAIGNLAKSKAIADATTLLFQASPEAWKAKSSVAAKAGDATTVEACEVRARRARPVLDPACGAGLEI
jgi:hypothetical protein